MKKIILGIITMLLFLMWILIVVTYLAQIKTELAQVKEKQDRNTEFIESLKFCHLDVVTCKLPDLPKNVAETQIWPIPATPDLTERERNKELVKIYADLYGIDNKLPLAIAKCESNFQNIPNRESHTKGAGIFMFIPSTWKAHCDGNRYDVEKNIECGIKLISRGEISRWGTSISDWGSYNCWKHAM